MPWRCSVGDKRQPIDPDKGKIAEKKTPTYTKSHGLGNIEAMMGQQVGCHTAFTVGGLVMGEIEQKVSSRLFVIVNGGKEPAFA